MPRIREQITVRCPVDEAFDYTTDFGHLADRNPGVVASRQTSSGPVEKGATFDVTIAFGSRQVPMEYTITDYQPPNRVVLVGEGSRQRAADEFTFTEVAEGTEITVTTDLSFKGPMRWIAPLLGSVFRKGGRQAVEGLAAALETVAD